MTRTLAMTLVRKRPKDARAWLQLGNVLITEGEADKARQCYTYAINRDPNLKEGYHALAALDLPPHATTRSWSYEL